MALTPGTRLGIYEVTAQIGEGGMGQVYRARDTKLNRDAALKILPDLFASDPDRLARFTREAQTLASLNHPNIAHIHGLEESSGVRALVMELAEGQDLSQRIARGAIPIDEALPIAKQIADALEAAHEQGIIHRDLKPANIKVHDNGTVKVLDFGLAKAMEPASALRASAGQALSMSPTITSPAMMTGVGMILGTAAYMSPEQARGRSVDRRADIWAFGAVLYEMLTGTRAFEDEDVSMTLSKVLQREPDFDALGPSVPARVRQALRLCLRKDPKQRVGDIRDVRLALEGAFETVAQQATAELPGPKGPGLQASSGRRVWMAAFGVALLAVVALAIPAVRYLHETPPPAPPETRVDIVTPATGDPISFALSPDGRQIVFLASSDGPSRLWLRSLATTTAQPLAGTEGASYPFWSPDSRSVGFFADGKLKRLDLGGGAPQTLALASNGRGGTWNADGVILFAPSTAGPLFRMSASGGQAAAVTKLDQQPSHRHPFFLPDGRQFLFYATGTAETSGIYLGSLDSGDTKRLTAADTRGLYMSSGWLLWVRAQALVAQRLDPERKALTGDPITLADPVAADTASAVSAASVSAAGLVAYRAGQAGLRQMTWFDRTGKAVGVAGEPDANNVNAPELSPDGRRVAIDRTVQANRDVWLMDLVRDGITRFTFDALVDGYPVWSPDGSRIAFESKRKGGSYDIWLKPSNGAGTEELLLETPNDEWPYDWSKDGRFLLYHVTDPKTGYDLWSLQVTGPDRKPTVVVNTPFTEQDGQFSPDGRWVAYETNESGRFEIVVQPFPEPNGKWQLSTGGGRQPRWRADGKELYFIGPDNKLMAVTVAASGLTFEAGRPVALFPTSVPTGGATEKAHYAVSRDGRFLMNQTIEESNVTPITLIQHWQPEAKK